MKLPEKFKLDKTFKNLVSKIDLKLIGSTLISLISFKILEICLTNSLLSSTVYSSQLSNKDFPSNLDITIYL